MQMKEEAEEEKGEEEKEREAREKEAREKEAEEEVFLSLEGGGGCWIYVGRLSTVSV